MYRSMSPTLIHHVYKYTSQQHTQSEDTWWRHQMETFFALLALCAGNSPVTCEFPAQRPVTRSFDVFFDPRLYKRLSKQSWGWWFETPSCPLWRHCNEQYVAHMYIRLQITNNMSFQLCADLKAFVECSMLTVSYVIFYLVQHCIPSRDNESNII